MQDGKMKKSGKSQRKLVLVNFPSGRAGLAVQTGVTPPTFADLRNKVPLVVLCVVLVKTALLLMISYAVYMAGVSLDPSTAKESYETSCQGAIATTTVFLAFSGVSSMMLWEMNVAKRAPQLNIETSFHRVIRFSILILVIAFGLLNSIQCDNQYTMAVELVLIFILFVVESTYHVILVMYIWKFNKFVQEERKKSVQFVNVKVEKVDGKKVIREVGIDYMNLEMV